MAKLSAHEYDNSSSAADGKDGTRCRFRKSMVPGFGKDLLPAFTCTDKEKSSNTTAVNSVEKSNLRTPLIHNPRQLAPNLAL